MFRMAQCAAAAAIATMSASAMAETVDLSYIGNTGLNTISLSGGVAYNGSHLAGHLTHRIESGPRAGQTFNTFCVEIAENANGGASTYEIVDLADAPRSNTPDSAGDNYGQVKADAVIRVLAKAVDMGWIDTSLQALGGSTADQMGAIQAAIWGALFGSTASSGDAGVAVALGQLSAQQLNNTTFSVMKQRVRAAVADGEQDQLYVVPLPTSALAGLGMLGGIAGVRTVRRRRA